MPPVGLERWSAAETIFLFRVGKTFNKSRETSGDARNSHEFRYQWRFRNGLYVPENATRESHFRLCHFHTVQRAQNHWGHLIMIGTDQCRISVEKFSPGNKKMSDRLPGDQLGSLRSFCSIFEGPLNPRLTSKVAFIPQTCGSHIHEIMLSLRQSHGHGKGQDRQTENTSTLRKLRLLLSISN